jgi:hypothetical protein
MRTMTDKRRLIFDTTGINRFAEDRKSADPLIAGLTSGYIVRVTATNVEESIATHNPLLMAAGLDKEHPSIPWLGNKRLQLTFG